MKLFRIFDAAEFVLDANVMLDLRRLPVERSEELLAILEDIADQVWMPLQFYAECKENLASARIETKKKYYGFKQRADSFRDKSLNLVKDFIRIAQTDVNPDIVVHLEQGFALLHQEFPTLLQHSHEQSYDSIEDRIDALLCGKERKELPESLRENIPSLWEWRMQHKIPPGLQDSGKPEPQRYGDLIGWLQIKRRAVETGRPIVIVTNDIKANGWFDFENGKPWGPHPLLVQELQDEAGVELYIYTSEQFIQIAEFYLRDRAIIASLAKRPLRFPRFELPDFGRLSAMASISTLGMELNVLGESWKDLHGSRAGFNTISDSMKHLHDSISGLGGLSDSINSVAGLGSVRDSWMRHHESFAGLNTFDDSFSGLRETMTGLGSVRDSWMRHHEPFAGLNMFDDSFSSLRETMTGLGSVRDSWMRHHEPFAGLNMFDDSFSSLRETMTGLGSVRDSRMRHHESFAGLNTFDDSFSRLRETMTGLGSVRDSWMRHHEPFAGLNMFDDSFSSLRETMTGLGSVRDSWMRHHESFAGLNTFDDSFSRLQETMTGLGSVRDSWMRHHESFAGLNTFDDSFSRLQETMTGLGSVGDSWMRLHDPLAGNNALGDSLESFLEQQSITSDLMETLLEEQQRIAYFISKNISLCPLCLCGEFLTPCTNCATQRIAADE